jgi:hypothetical protein
LKEGKSSITPNHVLYKFKHVKKWNFDYAVYACFLIMSSFVLQKTIRDNAEDDAYEKEHMPKKFEKEESK